ERRVVCRAPAGTAERSRPDSRATRREGGGEEGRNCPLGAGDAGAKLVERRGAGQGAGGGRQRFLAAAPGQRRTARPWPSPQADRRGGRPAAEATAWPPSQGSRRRAGDTRREQGSIGAEEIRGSQTEGLIGGG